MIPENDGPECLITSTLTIESVKVDPDEFTAILGIEPTSSGRIGKKYSPQSLTVLRTSFWSVGPHDQRSDDIDEGMRDVVETLWPERQKVAEFLSREDLSAAFTTSVTIYNSRPLYRLRPETLQKMAFFGVEYIFDIYDYSD